MTKRKEGFGGQRVVSFESRRAPEMASLIERHGGEAVGAPTVREATLEDGSAAREFAHALVRGDYDLVVFMTGVGLRALVAEVVSAVPQAEFVAALGRVAVLTRGPKPAAALKQLGVSGFIAVPPPNTWREVVAVLAERLKLDGLRVAVQEHGAPSVELYSALEALGARVKPVPVYRWTLPDDTRPLRSALHAIAKGEVRVVLFTSRVQVDHALAVAAEEGIADLVKERLKSGVIASIGPVCSEALLAEGLAPHVEPEHSNMGQLVKAAALSTESALAEGRI